MAARKTVVFSLIATAMVVALVVGALAVPVAAQGSALSTCDPAVQALVWAAEDAYGYNWQAQWAAGFPGGMTGTTSTQDTGGSDNDNGDDDEASPEPTAEATESASAVAAKIPSFLAQATEEPGDDNANDNESTDASGATTQATLNCDQLRADVVAFIFAQNDMSGATQPTFTVDGTQFVGEFSVQMSGPQEAPGPGDADGVGQGWLNFDEANNRVCWAITLGGIDFPATAAHIHQAPVGEAGPPVIPQDPPVDGNWVGCAEADPAVIQAILDNPGNFYVNVHTTPFPQGAVRGQLLGS